MYQLISHSMPSLRLSISGMSCQHCVRAVQGALQGVPGVRVEEVSIGAARIEYDPAQTSLEAIVDAVNDEGYGASREE